MATKPDDREKAPARSPITTGEQAGAEYERRTGRPWVTDADPGMLLAILAEARRRLVKGSAIELRRRGGGRALKDPGPLPDWWRGWRARPIERQGWLAKISREPLMATLLSTALHPAIEALFEGREASWPFEAAIDGATIPLPHEVAADA